MLSEKLQNRLFKDVLRIDKIVDDMVKRIEREDKQAAEWSRVYWHAHIKSALSDSYGGLGRLL